MFFEIHLVNEIASLVSSWDAWATSLMTCSRWWCRRHRIFTHSEHRIRNSLFRLRAIEINSKANCLTVKGGGSKQATAPRQLW